MQKTPLEKVKLFQLIYLLNYREVLYVSCKYKLNQCLEARMVYSFINCSEYMEHTEHMKIQNAPFSTKCFPTKQLLNIVVHISCTKM